MGALLIAAVIDLAGGDPGAHQDGLKERVANSLGIGLGGPVSTMKAPGGLLFSRSRISAAPATGLGARSRPWQAARGPDGAIILLAGDLFETDRLPTAITQAARESDEAAIYGTALAQHGDACDRLINGQYAAIAYYPEERRVRIARSPIQAPPLHLWRQGSLLVVASTPRVAFAAGAAEEIDRTKLEDALFLNFRDARRSWFRGIERIAPGELADITPDRTHRENYWSIDRLPEVRFPRDEDYVDAVQEAFRRGTEAMLSPFRSPALQLSGGLDSQAVGSFALDAIAQEARLKAYCWVPQKGYEPLDWPAATGDERDGARAFASMHGRVDLELVDTGALDLQHREDNFFLLAGAAPMGGSNMHWGHETLRRAAASGHDVMLTGASGNGSFSYDGRTGPPTWLREGRLVKAIAELAALGGDRPIWRRFISHALMPQLPLGWRQAWANRRGTAMDPFDSWCALDRDGASKSGVAERAARDGHDPLFLETRSSRQWRKAVIAMSEAEGGDAIQAMELLHGIPMRDPTSFRPLYELCAGIPDDQFLRNGTTRWLARRLLHGRIPEEVRTARRIGIQNSDWPIRFSGERAAMLAEIDRLENDEDLSAMLDLTRLRKWLEEWDGRDSIGGREGPRIYSAVGRGLIAARFFRHVGGRNG
ncbi:asparagine synthase-related protein [Croceicoccus mobilis]|uniref:asparagine synthase (glutamine-hydrolyzing) n=1 Tax=Croceicoccus mobilis TaxID=1703339 RepID=A0A916YXX6_9SPHN|nr:asparagine synthase-related protein [Croceicoccus mobilis]GGD66276.1 asparagine synthetase B [Croceicoccus mobilis]